VQKYDLKEMNGPIRLYADPLQGPAERLDSQLYAQARATIPTFCLDGLPCGHTPDGKRAIVLILRSGANPGDGPFRNQLWVVGGKWDMVSPWDAFVRQKMVGELFGGTYDGVIDIRGAIGNQLFGTSWAKGDDGPYGHQGVTLQYCYQLVIQVPITEDSFRPDRNHSAYKIITQGDELPELHPYVRDVIEMSAWLQ